MVFRSGRKLPTAEHKKQFGTLLPQAPYADCVIPKDSADILSLCVCWLNILAQFVAAVVHLGKLCGPVF